MSKEIITREVLESKYTTLESPKLNELLTQVRRHNPDIFVKAEKIVLKKFSWKNPFKPAISEHCEYTMYKMDSENRLLTINHDYNSIKSYLIGYIEGCSAGKRELKEQFQRNRRRNYAS